MSFSLLFNELLSSLFALLISCLLKKFHSFVHYQGNCVLGESNFVQGGPKTIRERFFAAVVCSQVFFQFAHLEEPLYFAILEWTDVSTNLEVEVHDVGVLPKSIMAHLLAPLFTPRHILQRASTVLLSKQKQDIILNERNSVLSNEQKHPLPVSLAYLVQICTNMFF